MNNRKQVEPIKMDLEETREHALALRLAFNLTTGRTRCVSVESVVERPRTVVL